jgi:Pyruvate/2-oxoacid:ferredoxin oxidoreductase gamma subunit
MSAQTEAVVQLTDLVKQSIQANAEVARAINEHRIRALGAHERNNIIFVAAFSEIYRLDLESKQRIQQLMDGLSVDVNSRFAISTIKEAQELLQSC